jgi:hypothetical protein
MDSATALFALQGIGLVLFLCIAFAQRFLWKLGWRRREKGPRFYPTNYVLGNAFQQLQQFVAPSTEYTIEEKLKEEAEEDDDGGADDPAKNLERQLRRIRRGERVATLTTILPDCDRRSKQG